MLPPFQRFLDEQRDVVYRYLVVAVGSNDADDAFQDTMLSALRAYPGLRDASNLRGWVLTIARNKALDLHRRRRHVADVEPPETPVYDDGQPDHELWEAVGGLPAKQRAAIVRRFVADLPYADIGRELGCSEAAARRSVFEGLRNLREVVER
jgi:RNA polymerase sigma factor (sigma-70 family)